MYKFFLNLYSQHWDKHDFWVAGVLPQILLRILPKQRFSDRTGDMDFLVIVLHADNM